MLNLFSVSRWVVAVVLMMSCVSSSAGKFQLNSSRFNSIGFSGKGISLKLKKSLNAFKETIPRVPNACSETLKVSTKSFAYNSALFVPLMLAMDIKNIKNVKPWLITGCEKGMNFAKASAIYAGGETLCRKLRNKDDRLNAYVGSGLSSAALKLKEGPFAIGQGFATGFAFMYAFDKVLGRSGVKAEYATLGRSAVPEMLAAPGILLQNNSSKKEDAK